MYLHNLHPQFHRPWYVLLNQGRRNLGGRGRSHPDQERPVEPIPTNGGGGAYYALHITTLPTPNLDF